MHEFLRGSTRGNVPQQPSLGEIERAWGREEMLVLIPSERFPGRRREYLILSRNTQGIPCLVTCPFTHSSIGYNPCYRVFIPMRLERPESLARGTEPEVHPPT